MSRHFAVGCAVFLIVAPCLNAQGTLQRMRWATNPDAYPTPFRPSTRSTPPSGNPSLPPNRDSSWGSFNAGSNDGEAIGGLVVIAAAVATSPFWGPHALFDRGFRVPGVFSSYPYAVEDGFLQIGEEEADACDDQKCGFWEESHLKRWSLRMSVEDGNDGNGLNRVGGQAFLDTSTRFGVLANWNYYSESLDQGGRDDTWLGDVNLTWRVTQCEWLQMHLGVGVRWQLDRVKDELGFNTLYRADLFPFDPAHLTTLIEVGTLHEALVLHAQAALGMNYRRWQGFVGYDFLRVGSVNLQGPFLGLRAWF